MGKYPVADDGYGHCATRLDGGLIWRPRQPSVITLVHQRRLDVILARAPATSSDCAGDLAEPGRGGNRQQQVGDLVLGCTRGQRRVMPIPGGPLAPDHYQRRPGSAA